MEVKSLLPQKVCLRTFYIKNIHFLCIFGGTELSTSETHKFLHSLRTNGNERRGVLTLEDKNEFILPYIPKTY